MIDRISPKQVARALDVSESSVKRWCDRGMIPVRYTSGGHRRIAVSDLLDFVKNSKHELVHPESLGLPAMGGQGPRTVDKAQELFTRALLAGDEESCRRIALDLYLAEVRLARMCDEVFATAFREIGDLWSCGEAEVYQERRACDLMQRVLHDLSEFLPSPGTECPLAIGGTVSGDYYTLPTSMAELVLRESGWQAKSLGPNLPYETLAAAIETLRPRLFWLSCSHLNDKDEFLRGYSRLFEEYGESVAFVVGGTDLSDDLRHEMRYAAFCDTMQHLETFAQTLLAAIQTDTSADA